MDARGVLAVVDAAMVEAVRAVTVARGVDPRDLALVAFGGAGPMHACAVAEALGMAAVVVPPRAGVLAAVGLLSSPRQVTQVASVGAGPREGGDVEAATARFDVARAAARRLVGAGPGVPARVMLNHGTGTGTVSLAEGGAVAVEVALDCRYRGQSHELTVPSVAAFAGEHRRRNGYTRRGTPVEVTAVRATAVGPAPLGDSSLPPGPDRARARGPAVLAEADCTVWVAPGWTAVPGGGGSWVLRREGSP